MYEISYIIKIIKRYHFSNRLSWREYIYFYVFLNRRNRSTQSREIIYVERTKIIHIVQFYGKSKSCFPRVTFPTMRRCHPSIYPADSGYVPKTVEIRVNVQPRCSMETNGDFGCHFCLCGYVLKQWPKFISSFIMKLQILWYIKHYITQNDYKCFWLRTVINQV